MSSPSLQAKGNRPVPCHHLLSWPLLPHPLASGATGQEHMWHGRWLKPGPLSGWRTLGPTSRWDLGSQPEEVPRGSKVGTSGNRGSQRQRAGYNQCVFSPSRAVPKSSHVPLLPVPASAVQTSPLRCPSPQGSGCHVGGWRVGVGSPLFLQIPLHPGFQGRKAGGLGSPPCPLCAEMSLSLRGRRRCPQQAVVGVKCVTQAQEMSFNILMNFHNITCSRGVGVGGVEVGSKTPAQTDPGSPISVSFVRSQTQAPPGGALASWAHLGGTQLPIP